VTRTTLAKRIIDRYGPTFVEQAGIEIRNEPASLFQTLVFALLTGALTPPSVAASAARALFDEGWTTPKALSDSPWEGRAKVLESAGYTGDGEETARTLGEATVLVLTRWGGDLRKLRQEAGRDGDQIRGLLQEIKGIGPAGADIFICNAQRVWPECYPSIDHRALLTAHRLGLGENPEELAQLVPRQELPRLICGLVHIDLDGAHDEFTLS
jgi:hypothetical protein